MPFWEREPFPHLIDEGHFAFDDPGPLHSPIRSFKLRRTEKLELVLETECGKESIIKGLLRDDTPLDESNQIAKIKSIGGTIVSLTGVISESVETHENYRQDISELRETARIFGIEADFAKKNDAIYTIDWLENIGHYYHWPDSVVNDRDTAHKRAYGRASDSLVLTDSDGEHSSGSAALKLIIGGIQLILTVNRRLEGTEQIRPGYILYHGTPNDETRRKIRTILSYALGYYLVYLGCSAYTTDWQLTSFRAVRGYSMDMRAFELHVLPPAWLGTNSHNVLDTAKIERLTSGLYAHYDELDFGNLSWGYWHAMCAPLHIKAVHFGAIIEALQRNYLASHASDFSEKIVTDGAKWAAFVRDVDSTINRLGYPDDQSALLRANIGRLNQMPRAELTVQVLQRLGLVLGDDERQAWKRRHDAAHGNPMTPGREREVIRDSHLLHVIFNRMVLQIVDGNDHYYDYAARPSPNFPFRDLREPVPEQSRTA